MINRFKHIILVLSMMSTITVTAQTSDSTIVSEDELSYWLKEFAQEVVDTLQDKNSGENKDTVSTTEDRISYLLKGFGSEVLDTLSEEDVTRTIEDTKKILDDKLGYLLKGFGTEVIDTLSSADVSKTIEDTKQLIDDKLGYLLKGFGGEILDTLKNSATLENGQDSNTVDNELDYLLKSFGAEVLDTLSSGEEKGGIDIGKAVNIAAKILEVYGDSLVEQSEQLEVEVDKLIKKVEPILVDTFSTKRLLNSVDSALINQKKSTINPLFLDWVFGAPDAISLSLSDEDSIIVDLRNHVKEYVRATSPELYAYHISQLPDITDLRGNKLRNIEKENLLLNVGNVEIDNKRKLDIELPSLPKWSLGARFQLHASQNYISDNWYKGGESNIAVQSYVLGYFRYDNRAGLEWDSKVEWKVGLNSSSSDTLRWLRVNEDLFRINSKVGYKAFKNFYYTAELDFQTQFFNTFKSNSNIRTSGPFSPIRTSFSLGMDYKYKKMISLFVSPISYKYIFVADTTCKEGVSMSDNIPNQVGLKDGARKSHQLGALIRFDFEHDFNESIGMEVKFNLFGNYVGKIKGVELGCEIIGNFKINRFLTARAILYPRYDSTVLPADGGKPKLQFWELISLGFTYRI